jgi:predicted PurR-regulated permease PerM
MNELNTKENVSPVGNDWGSRSNVHTLLLMALTVGGIYICYLLATPFLSALTWALALAVLFAPLYRWIGSKVKYPNLAALICVLLAALIVLVPVTFVAERTIVEAARGAETIKTMVESGELRRVFGAHPYIAPVGNWIEKQFDLPGIANNVSSWLTKTAASFVHGSVLKLIGIVLTFYILFYFLRDRDAALQSLRSLSPLSEKDMNRIFDGVNDTVYATIYGRLAVGVVQGSLGGLMFWWLGLPAPFLWGIVMALLAVAPVLGAFVVWIPAAIFLFMAGSEGKALLLTLWGAIVVGGIDNLLYPILVGTRLKMHTVVTFVSIVGGLIVFGPFGLILGPVMFTVTRIVLEIWTSQNIAEMTNGNDG